MSLFVCTNCGEGSASWIGRCPNCKEWNTFKEFRQGQETKGRPTKEKQKMVTTSLSNVKTLDKSRTKTGIYEFDRVLGGGIVKGEIILLTGEPGVGKSTLLLQSIQNISTLYISGEESAEQVKERALRLGANLQNLTFSDTLQIESIEEGIEEMKDSIDLIVIDSIQTVYTTTVESTPGSVAQVREAGAQLVRIAKQNNIPIIIVGHVTKEGEIAGPKTLEHMVDAVLNFEGERVSHFRVLRAQKNRFGSSDEIGIFEMKGGGLIEVNNPMAFVDDDISGNVPGKAVIGSMEGKRPLFFEIQTLASPTMLAMPRRVVKGVDYNKMLLILAVLTKHIKLGLSKYDIYINVVGGVDVKSTAADLGIAASIISSVKNIPFSSKIIFTGELGLLGEIRSVYGQEKVLNEAKRLKFNRIYSSENVKSIKQLYTHLLK